MADEVAALVLRDNYEQAQAISSSTAQAASMVEVHERYVRSLEQAGTLNRELEFLPTDEGFDERQAAGGGLTPPEFATLLSHTKIALSQELLASDLPDDPHLSSELERYFPTRARASASRTQLPRHPLRREIVASRVANDLVNRAGTTFAFRLSDETGAGADDIARAYAVAREVFGLRGLWREIEALDGQVARARRRSRCCSERASCSSARRAGSCATVRGRWTSRRRSRATPRGPRRSARRSGAARPAEVEAARRRPRELAAAGVPPELAQRVAHLESLVPALDLVEIAAAAEVDVAVGGRGLLRARRPARAALAARPHRRPARETRWEAMARAALRDDVYAEQAGLDGRGVCAVRPAGVERLAPGYREREAVERSLQVLADIRTAAPSTSPGCPSRCARSAT